MRLPQDRILHIGTEIENGKVNVVAEWQGELVRCKDCKYFELDHFDRIDDMPIITAHEICTKWSGGSKTSKDGFCFMGEKRERE